MINHDFNFLNSSKSKFFHDIIVSQKSFFQNNNSQFFRKNKFQTNFSSTLKNQSAFIFSITLLIIFGSCSAAQATPIISFDQSSYLSGSFYPITITIDDSSNPLFTSPESGTQKILATLSTSVEEKKIILTETDDSSGIFTTKLGFSELPYEFHVNDVIGIIQPDLGNNSRIDEIENITVSINIHDSSLNLKETLAELNLTETDVNTGIFTGEVTLVSDFTTDSKIKVEPGDLIIYQLGFVERVGIVLPNSNDGVNMIKIALETCDNDIVDLLTISYLDKVDSANILKNDFFCEGAGGGGGGGGALLRPGLVLNFIGALLGGSTSEPPTLGLDQSQKRIVDGGFSFNDNPIDVMQYYTPYPLITTPVGQNNTIKLKIYEEKGLDNIAHVGLSYGLGKGEIFNEGRATIEYDRTFDGIESVTLFDPKHVLGSVNVTTSDVRCGNNTNAVCREFAFHHIFREPLEYNMVATNIWDFDRNSWQNYFNHGIQIVGNSMNPPEEYLGIYQGHIFHLTETSKNIAIDDEGNSWTFDKIWNRDYLKPIFVDSDILNQKKIDAIEKLGFDYSDGQKIFGFERVDHRFEDTRVQQAIEAQGVMSKLCSKCQKEPFEKINDIFSYEMPTRYSKLNDPETRTQINLENQRAQEFLKHYFEKLYPGRIYD